MRHGQPMLDLYIMFAIQLMNQSHHACPATYVRQYIPLQLSKKHCYITFEFISGTANRLYVVVQNKTTGTQRRYMKMRKDESTRAVFSTHWSHCQRI